MRPTAALYTNDLGSVTGAEYLSGEELRRIAKELTEHPNVTLIGFAVPFDFVDRLAADRRTITAVYRSARDASATGETLTPAAGRQLSAGVVVSDSRAPRVVAHAWLCIAHSNCAFVEARLSAVVEAHQHTDPLRIGELWALPSVLRMVLLVFLTRLATLIDRHRTERHQANALAERLFASDDGPARLALLTEQAALTDSDSFSSQLLYRLRDGATATRDVVDWLDKRLALRGSDVEEVLIVEQTRLSASNVTIGNIIGSLRAIDDNDWREWFERVSRVDALLDAESDFAALDFPTRDRYRAAIERLARRSGSAEIEVTRRAIACATAARDATPEASAAGNERERLERELGARVPFARRVGRW